MDISDSTLAPRTLLFLFTCGTVVGCAATDQPPEQPDETPSVDTSAATPVATPEPITQDTTPPPLDPAAFREQVRLELADLTNGTTPDMWMESHTVPWRTGQSLRLCQARSDQFSGPVRFSVV